MEKHQLAFLLFEQTLNKQKHLGCKKVQGQEEAALHVNESAKGQGV